MRGAQRQDRSPAQIHVGLVLELHQYVRNAGQMVKITKRKIAVTVSGLVLALAGGAAYASIPAPDGSVHGCYKNSNPAKGALITIDSSESCPSGYTALN